MILFANIAAVGCFTVDFVFDVFTESVSINFQLYKKIVITPPMLLSFITLLMPRFSCAGASGSKAPSSPESPDVLESLFTLDKKSKSFQLSLLFKRYYEELSLSTSSISISDRLELPEIKKGVLKTAEEYTSSTNEIQHVLLVIYHEYCGFTEAEYPEIGDIEKIEREERLMFLARKGNLTDKLKMRWLKFYLKHQKFKHQVYIAGIKRRWEELDKEADKFASD